jgi:hypothetical protein
MRVGLEEKTSVKVVKAVENCVVCVTVHNNIMQILIIMAQRGRRFQSTGGCTRGRTSLDVLEKRMYLLPGIEP